MAASFGNFIDHGEHGLPLTFTGMGQRVADEMDPTGPQWGEGDSPTTGATQVLEQAIAEREADLRDWLVRAGMSHERRILRLPIGRLTWHYPQPDILQLEFVLPAGCFATVLVRELVDLVSLGQTDSLCVF